MYPAVLLQKKPEKNQLPWKVKGGSGPFWLKPKDKLLLVSLLFASGSTFGTGVF